MNQAQPMQQFMLVTYEDVYMDSANAVNPSALLYDVPVGGAMAWMALLSKQVTYAFSDTEMQYKIALSWSTGLTEKERFRFVDFLLNHQALLITPYTTFMFYALVSQYGNDKVIRQINENDIPKLVKAYLYCNNLYIQKQNTELASATDRNALLMKVDIILAEYKLPKHFVVQLHKAALFFEFCEQDKKYKTYVDLFCQSWGIQNWSVYILALFNIYTSVISNFQICPSSYLAKKIMDKYTFPLGAAETKVLWNGADTSIKYFRDHFLLKNTQNGYIILNEILLVDKIYQGLLFDIAKVLQVNGIKDEKGKDVNFGSLKSEIGLPFSEKYLCYDLLGNIFNNQCDIQIKGEEMDAKKVPAPSDYYVRKGNTLFIFECKDILLTEDITHINNMEDLKKEIFINICYDGPDPKKPSKTLHKGFGQLLNSIDLLINHSSMDELDNGVSEIKEIYPIVLVVSDKSYSALGINGLVNEEFNNIIKAKSYNFKDVVIKSPIIVDYESLLRMGRRLHEGIISFKQLLDGYLSNFAGWPNSSFISYCQDFYLLKQAIEDNEKDTQYMILDQLNQIIPHDI